MGKDPSKLVEYGAKFIAWLAKPLYFRANIKPLLHSVTKHLESEYGKDLVESPAYKLKLGEGDPTLEHGIFRVYIPPGELFRKLNENRESMLIQHYVRNSLVPDMQYIHKEFHDAMCIAETTEMLEKDKDAKKKVRYYNRQVLEKNQQNSYIIPVAVAAESKELKPILRRASKALSSDRRKNNRITSATKIRLKKDIEVKKNKWKKYIDNTERNLSTLSDKDLIKSARKSLLEYTRKYQAETIVKSIVRQKSIRTNDGTILSYLVIAETIRDNPGISSKKLASVLGKPEVSYIQYGIIALLKHKNGLDLIQRKKLGKVYILYPSEKFKALLKKYNDTPSQKELSDFD